MMRNYNKILDYINEYQKTSKQQNIINDVDMIVNSLIEKYKDLDKVTYEDFKTTIDNMILIDNPMFDLICSFIFALAHNIQPRPPYSYKVVKNIFIFRYLSSPLKQFPREVKKQMYPLNPGAGNS